jgi:hypothetical protein
MKRLATLIVFVAVAVSAIAQTTPPVKPPAASAAPAAPSIPPDLLKRFWQADDAQQRAQRELDQAQQAKRSADADWQAAVKALGDACGDKFQIKQDVVGQDPYCGAKPVAAVGKK